MRLLLLISALMVVAFAFGGGGVRYGLANLVIQLSALAILAFHGGAFLEFWKRSPLALRGLIGLSLLLPILHLIPLPDALWTMLPGRDLVAQSRGLIDAQGWSPASVDPARTLVALSGLIVPLVIVNVGWSIPQRRLMTVGWVAVATGLVCVALGAVQIMSGGTDGILYSERPPSSILYGTFANRNSTGVYLVGTLALASLLPLPLARPHPSAPMVRIGMCALLVLGIVLTQSRTSLVLAAIPLGLGGLRALASWRAASRSQRITGPNRANVAMFAALVLGVVAVGGMLSYAPGRLGDTLERFEAKGDPRSYIWDDAAYSVERFWPVGAGMGTFDEVFQVDEALENLTVRRAGRAHNDYIEVAIEAGIPGLVVIAGWLVLVGWLSWQAGRSQFRWAGWAGSAILLAAALQSITDYPLRNQSMLALAGFALLLLARVATDRGEGERR
jgi:O-antigen ligase